MAVISLYSMKGGVGKTSCGVNLAYLASRDIGPTLLCDLDPQGSSSFYFRIRSEPNFSAKKFLKGGKSLEKNIKATDFENLDLIPSTLSFRTIDIKLGNQKHSRSGLRRLFEPLEKEYKMIFIDCPPNITLESENIFLASNMILVPIIPTVLSLVSLEKLRTFFDNKGLKKKKIYLFLSMADRRKKLHRENIEKIPEYYKRTLNTIIPYTSLIEKMGIQRKPVVVSNPRSAAALAFEKLWKEILQILNN